MYVCSAYTTAAQAESWGTWQHSAGLISAHIMLQAPKPHLNLVPNYRSLPGPALLLPVLNGDILVHSLSCTLFCILQEFTMDIRRKNKANQNRSATRSILAL